MKRFLAVFVISAAALAGGEKKAKDDPALIGSRDAGKGVNLYSIEREMALGRQLAAEVAREAKLVDDPVLTEFVNRLGQNLVRNSDAKAPFSFKLIADNRLNAFALPGGFVFVNTGLLAAAETEAELAAAMAHEIAHVAGRHMTRQASRRQIVDLLTLPALVLGGWTGYAARQGAGMGIPMTFLKLDRAFEEEADYLAVQYLWAAGYDPLASVDLFERMQTLERRKPGAIERVFASHPMSAERARKVQVAIDEILPQKQEYVVDTSEYQSVRGRLLQAKPERKPGEKPVLRRRELVE